MHEFSTVDGFVEISESLAEMIKYVANEPSVGLYYIQQHTQNAVPNISNLKNCVLEKSREMVLQTEDLEDSITMVRSMKECGLPIANDIIADIKNSLAIMATEQPRRGVIRGISPWGSATSSSGSGLSGERSNYFSSVFRSARQRATDLKWPQFEVKEQPTGPEMEASAMVGPSVDREADELPLSSEAADEALEGSGLLCDKPYAASDNYDKFKADRDAKLEAWLGGTDGKKSVNNVP